MKTNMILLLLDLRALILQEPHEVDISKRIESGHDLHELDRSHKYHILTTEPNSYPSVYPQTRPCSGSAY